MLAFRRRGSNARERGAYGEFVADGSEARDAADGKVGQERVVTERLARMHVRQVQLDEWQRHPGEGIAQRHAGVRECAGVDDDEIDAVTARRVDAADQFMLRVALEGRQPGAEARRQLRAAGHDGFERVPPIDLRFPLAKQVQIGSIQQKQVRHRRALYRNMPVCGAFCCVIAARTTLLGTFFYGRHGVAGAVRSRSSANRCSASATR